MTDKRLAYLVAYNATHKEEMAAYRHEYYVAHREESAAKCKEYNTTHREEIKAKKAVNYAAHKEEARIKHNTYRAANREKDNAWNAAYAKRHPEQRCLLAAKRRALKYGNTPIAELLTEAQWRDILDLYHHRCAYCGRKCDKLTIDHVMPLAKGGKHSANNVVPSCQHCNSVKGARTPKEWTGLAVTP
jgi:5-methylcytosine-specific restriction endonuclease McrA